MYRRCWLLSACTSNSGQQESMCLAGSVCLIEGTYAQKAGQAQRRCLDDRAKVQSVPTMEESVFTVTSSLHFSCHVRF